MCDEILCTKKMFSVVSFSFPLSSASTLLLSLAFLSSRASISSTLIFLNSTNSCCIFACAFRIVVILIVEGPDSFALAILLRVDTINFFLHKILVGPMVGANCYYRAKYILRRLQNTSNLQLQGYSSSF